MRVVIGRFVWLTEPWWCVIKVVINIYWLCFLICELQTVKTYLNYFTENAVMFQKNWDPRSNCVKSDFVLYWSILYGGGPPVCVCVCIYIYIYIYIYRPMKFQRYLPRRHNPTWNITYLE